MERSYQYWMRRADQILNVRVEEYIKRLPNQDGIDPDDCDLVYQIIDDHFEARDIAADLVESPIELILFLEILLHPKIFGHRFRVFGPDVDMGNSDGIALVPQAPLFGFRADLLFIIKCGDEEREVSVECDGHNFHERTKEQAARDRSRDREFLRRGIEVMRFTGSEIWNDTEGCADEIAEHIISQLFRLFVLRKAKAAK